MKRLVPLVLALTLLAFPAKSRALQGIAPGITGSNPISQKDTTEYRNPLGPIEQKLPAYITNRDMINALEKVGKERCPEDNKWCIAKEMNLYIDELKKAGLDNPFVYKQGIYKPFPKAVALIFREKYGDWTMKVEPFNDDGIDQTDIGHGGMEIED